MMYGQPNPANWAIQALEATNNPNIGLGTVISDGVTLGLDADNVSDFTTGQLQSLISLLNGTGASADSAIPDAPQGSNAVIVGDSPDFIPTDPNALISSTNQDSSGYGAGFSAPTAAVPAQAGLSSTMLWAIIAMCVAAFLWIKHFREK